MSFSAMGNPALLLQGGGALTSAIGAFYNSSGQKAALASTAQTAQLNAQLAEQSAQQTLAAGQAQEEQVREHGAQVQGAQRAAFAANGVDVNSGSAAIVQGSTDVQSRVDAMTVRMNAIREAFGQRIQSTNYENEARMATVQSKGISPLLSSATSLLGSSGQIASSWYRLNKSGAAVPSY